MMHVIKNVLFLLWRFFLFCDMLPFEKNVTFGLDCLIMQVCADCNIPYKTRHTCRAGRCPHCNTFLCDLPPHVKDARCPILKLRAFQSNPESIGQPNTVECVVCHSTCFLKNTRLFKGYEFCLDCFNSTPEIAREQQMLRMELHLHLVKQCNTYCYLCFELVLDANGNMIKQFELDHVNRFAKSKGVGHMCLRGENLQSILAEADKCRPLCVDCHSAVTHVQQRAGLLHLSEADVPVEIFALIDEQARKLRQLPRQ